MLLSRGGQSFGEVRGFERYVFPGFFLEGRRVGGGDFEEMGVGETGRERRGDRGEGMCGGEEALVDWTGLDWTGLDWTGADLGLGWVQSVILSC